MSSVQVLASSLLLFLTFLLPVPAPADNVPNRHRVARPVEWPRGRAIEGFEVLAGRLLITIPSGQSRISINNSMFTVFYPDRPKAIQFEILEESRFFQEITGEKLPSLEGKLSLADFMKVVFTRPETETPPDNQNAPAWSSAKQLKSLFFQEGNRVETFENGPLTVYQLSRSQIEGGLEAFVLDRERPDQAVHIYSKMFRYDNFREILGGIKVRDLK